MRKKICDYINSSTYTPSSYEQLKAALNILPEEEELFKETMNALVEEGSIFYMWGRYQAPGTSGLYAGTIHIKDDFGFISCPSFKEDLYVFSKNLNNALNGDFVAFTTHTHAFHGEMKTEATVEYIIHHGSNEVVGVLKKTDRLIIEPLEPLDVKIIVDNVNGSHEGDAVKARVTRRNNSVWRVDIVENFGKASSKGNDIYLIAAKYGFSRDFREDTLNQALSLVNKAEEEAQRRRKPTLNHIITVDGEDTKDIDDAVAVRKNSDGTYLLGVYIADVSYYVTPQSPLDKEAYERGTSVYLIDKVVPMLPVALSNDLCSLNEKTLKLAEAVEMVISADGKVLKKEAFETVIESCHRMTYTKVQAIIDNDSAVCEEYSDIVNDVKVMAECAQALKAEHVRKGEIDFEVPEAKIIVDEKGKVIDIKLRERGEAEELIEQFMVTANESVAEIVYDMNLPFIYRVHDKPKADRMEEYNKNVQMLGLKALSESPSALEIQKFINGLDETHMFLHRALIASMAKACYSDENIGHFGLGSACYTHFTSPIRRYPDLLVHRLLRRYVFQKNIPDEKECILLEDRISEQATQCSKKERDAMNAEYEADDKKMAEYMENHVGEEYTGTITGVSKFGFFVELPNTVEGLVSLKTLPQNYKYIDVPASVAAPNDITYALGDTVVVKVAKADHVLGQIDFEVKRPEDAPKAQRSLDSFRTNKNNSKDDRKNDYVVKDKKHGESKANDKHSKIKSFKGNDTKTKGGHNKTPKSTYSLGDLLRNLDKK